MYWNITSVEHIEGYRLKLCFEDGSRGVADLSRLRFEGVFEPLKDLDYFRRVQVDPETATIAWPNGVDLDPLVLYSQATGKPLPDFGSGPVAQAS